jgi:hypothetical protein
MELDFDYAPDRRYYALRFVPGGLERVPFVPELRFWGVDRAPCPRLGTLAALIALGAPAPKIVTVPGGGLSPPVVTALSGHFGLEIHPGHYDADRRDLAGGEKTVAPVRFGAGPGPGSLAGGTEVLTWSSLDDLRGPLGGAIRTNLDAFDLFEGEKNLIVALCCAGRDLGHILVDGVDPALGTVLHRIGLELAVPAGTF